MSKASESKHRKEIDDDYNRARRLFVWNRTSIALRLIIKPVFAGDKAWGANVLEMREEPLLLNPWISPLEIQEAEDLLRKYGVMRDSFE